METPQSLSPRSPLDSLEGYQSSMNGTPQQQNTPTSTAAANGVNNNSSSNANNNNSSSSLHNDCNGTVTSPAAHPVPTPVPLTIPSPVPVCISQSPSPATPVEKMVESTQSLKNERRVPPAVPPRRCRTRSPTPNTSKGKKSHTF